MAYAWELKKCDKPDCWRQVKAHVAYCCSECAVAAEGRYEVHAHSEGCEQRHAERGEYGAELAAVAAPGQTRAPVYVGRGFVVSSADRSAAALRQASTPRITPLSSDGVGFRSSHGGRTVLAEGGRPLVSAARQPVRVGGPCCVSGGL